MGEHRPAMLAILLMGLALMAVAIMPGGEEYVDSPLQGLVCGTGFVALGGIALYKMR